MTATKHARQGRFAAFLALFRYNETRPPHPRVTGMGTFDAPVYRAPVSESSVRLCPDQQEPTEPQQDPTEPWGPWDTPDGLLMDERALLDGRVAPGYVPGPMPYVPDVAADLTYLPVFRAAVERRTRHRAKECLCGCQVDGQAWGERMVAVAGHLTGTEVTA